MLFNSLTLSLTFNNYISNKQVLHYRTPILPDVTCKSEHQNGLRRQQNDDELKWNIRIRRTILAKENNFQNNLLLFFRSYCSSNSSISSVGTGIIGRAVRAMVQNDYFDSFFEKISESNDEYYQYDAKKEDNALWFVWNNLSTSCLIFWK